jgi:hypothetical protein
VQSFGNLAASAIADLQHLKGCQHVSYCHAPSVATECSQ